MYRRLQIEHLDSRLPLAAEGFEHAGIGYFIDSEDSQLHRYDIENESWLTSIAVDSLIGKPTVGAADADGIYIAFGSALYRYAHDGGSRVHLLNTSSAVEAIHPNDDVLLVNYSNEFDQSLVSIRKTNNTIIDAWESHGDALHGSALIPGENKIVGRSQSIAPADMTFVTFDDEGFFDNSGDGPYHGSFPDASKVWAYPDGSKVVDDSGTLYESESLLYVGSFSQDFHDLVFWQESVPVLLHGQNATRYGDAFLPETTFRFDREPSRILVNSENVVAFFEDASQTVGFATQVVPVSSFHQPQIGDPIDPEGLVYSPDFVTVTDGSDVLLYSSEYSSLFIWSPRIGHYIDSIPLRGTPDYVTYSPLNDTVYLAYASGAVRQIELGLSGGSEVPFVNLASAPLGIGVAGNKIYTTDNSGHHYREATYSFDGALLDASAWSGIAQEYVWSDANEKLFFVNDASSGYLSAKPIGSEGEIGNVIQSRVNPEYGSSVRVSPDGNQALVSSGRFFDASTLTPEVKTLPHRIRDAAWLGDRLYTSRDILGVTQFQRWSKSTYELLDVVQYVGSAVSLRSLSPEYLIGIHLDANGVPCFKVFDAGLREVQLDRLPIVNWSVDGPLYYAEALGDERLNARSNVPGVFSYSPGKGQVLDVGEHTVTATFTPEDLENYDSVTVSRPFEVLGLDFGDAGTGYPTLVSDDGARHVIGNDLRLGELVDYEVDGQPTASGDDRSGDDDEDGIRFTSEILTLPTEPTFAGFVATLSTKGFLDAWIDFNHDGDWDDAGEQISGGEEFEQGQHWLSILVPAGASIGTTSARFRVSSSGALAPSGLALDGEVEDYLVDIRDGRNSVVRVDVPSGQSVRIDSVTTDVVVESWADDGVRPVLRIPISELQALEIVGSAGPNLFEISNLPEGLQGKLVCDGATGDNILSIDRNDIGLDFASYLTASNFSQIVSLPQSRAGITLNSKAVKALGGDEAKIEIIDAIGNGVDFADSGWSVLTPTLVGGQLSHRVGHESGGPLVEISNQLAFTNPLEPLDVNRDGAIAPSDVLAIINSLNLNGSYRIPTSFESLSNHIYLDVSADRFVAPSDALRVINYLNMLADGEGEIDFDAMLQTDEILLARER